MGEAKRRKTAGQYPEKTEKPPRPTRAPSDTVSWEVVGDLTAHPKSADVLQLLERLKEEFEGVGGNEMVAVLEDEAQRPIILVRTIGLGAFMSLVSELQDLGLEDRLVDAEQPERGLDAAFS